MFATLLSTGTQSDTSRHYAAIATAAFAGVTAAAAIYAARQVRIAKAALRAQLSRDLWQKWQDLAPARKAAIRYSPRQLAIRYEYLFSTSSGGYYLLRQIPDFFEELAVLREVRGISLRHIRKMFGSVPVLHWQDWHLAIASIRRLEQGAGYRPDNDASYGSWEHLARKP